MTPAHAYQHGGSPEKDMARLGVSERPVTDFSVNLNPLGRPPLLRERWMELWDRVEGYPSVEGEGVARYYEAKFGIPSGRFLAGNGSTELIYLIPRVLRLGRAAVISPSYHDYERACLLAGTRVIHLPLASNSGFSPPDPNQVERVLASVDAVWLGRPNNPTASLLARTVLLDLADRFPDKWFIVDEAFIQFLEDWKEESLLLESPRPNLVVIHSLTKFYAVAGLRLGGAVADERVIERLRHAKEPWTVNGVADRAAALLAESGGFDEQTRSHVGAEVKRVFSRLEALEGITPFPSPVNYLLCQWVRTDDLDDLLRHLLGRGVYVRDCRNFAGLERGYFRVGLRAPRENDRLLECLASACGRFP